MRRNNNSLHGRPSSLAPPVLVEADQLGRAELAALPDALAWRQLVDSSLDDRLRALPSTRMHSIGVEQEEREGARKYGIHTIQWTYDEMN